MIEKWVEQCRNGRSSAYAKVVNELQPKILEFLYRMTQNREWAEDLGQEAFLRAFRLLDRYDQKKAAFSTWLFTIARNLCLDELRKRRYRTVELGEAVEIRASTKENPFCSMHESQMENLIAQAVEELDPEYREVFVLKEYQDLSLEEIATIVECPVGTVKSRLHRSRIQLQKKLTPILDV